jgi:hypothetical protein
MPASRHLARRPGICDPPSAPAKLPRHGRDAAPHGSRISHIRFVAWLPAGPPMPSPPWIAWPPSAFARAATRLVVGRSQ